LVEVEEQGTVHAIEVKGERERLADAAVVKGIAAAVQDEGLHRFAGALRERLLDHVSRLEGRKDIFGRPALGAILKTDIADAALDEGLPGGVHIEKIGVAALVEIVATDIDRQI